ncbi:ATP-binding cassette domain-containing protein, partial [Georgenia sp. 10Sc9-8]|nr:ATP-binding cassette domain-containing protein [Georgenia halotolerans]
MYLRTEDLTKRFGGVVATDGVTLGVARGEVLGLVGPNGAGKSTLLQMLDGVVPPDAGRIVLDGTAVQGWSPQRLAAAGVGRTFQTARVFPGLTVWESVMVGAYTGVLHEDRGLTTGLTVRDMVGSALGLRSARARQRRAA